MSWKSAIAKIKIILGCRNNEHLKISQNKRFEKYPSADITTDIPSEIPEDISKEPSVSPRTPLPEYIENWGDCYSPDEEVQVICHYCDSTCKKCAKMDGTHLKLSERIEGVNFPPFHENCTCMVIPHSDEWDLKHDTKAAKNALHKTIYIPRTMSFQDYWQVYFIEGRQSDLEPIPHGMRNRYRRNVKQYLPVGLPDEYKFSQCEDNFSAKYDTRYATVLFLNAYQKPTPLMSIEQYFKYLYREGGISDPREFHVELIKKGYYRKLELYEYLQSFKIDKLKDILATAGVVSVGGKTKLIEKILASVPVAELANICAPIKYILSDAGMDFLEKNAELLILHKYKYLNISVQEYLEQRQISSCIDDTVFEILKRRALECFWRGDVEYEKLLCFFKENGNKKLELMTHLHMLYLAVNGSRDNVPSNIIHCADYRWSFMESARIFSPQKHLQSLKKINFNEIRNLYDYFESEMLEQIFRQELPYVICDRRLFEIFLKSIWNRRANMQILYSNLKQNYRNLCDKVACSCGVTLNWDEPYWEDDPDAGFSQETLDFWNKLSKEVNGNRI